MKFENVLLHTSYIILRSLKERINTIFRKF